MTTAIMKPTNGTYALTTEDIHTLVTSGIIPRGTPEPTIRMFAKFCGESNLSPFKKQVHLIARFDNKASEYRYTIQTGIDGYRAVADRTGQYAGNDDYRFDGGATEYEMIASKKSKPTTATATVYKLVGGQRAPFTATAHWDEYYPGEKMGFMWNKMPFLMLGKCAEALALRKAFPNELSGIYTNEEMAQAPPPVEVKVETIPNAQPAQLPHAEPVEEVPPPTPEEVRKIADEDLGGQRLSYEDEKLPFGKSKGKRFKDIPADSLKGAADWIQKNNVEKYYDLREKILSYLNDTGLPF